MLWLIISKDIAIAINIFVSILVVACPCSLGLATPLAIVIASGNASRKGILVKTSEALENFHKAKTICFDKTGTLTIGNPQVADEEIYTDNVDEVLTYLASVENESDHPLANAVVEHIGVTKLYPVEKTEVVKGGGIVAQVEGHSVAVGNVALMEREDIHLSERACADITRFEKNGNSLVLISVDNELKALIGIRDQIRPGVKEDLQKLKKLPK